MEFLSQLRIKKKNPGTFTGSQSFDSESFFGIRFPCRWSSGTVNGRLI